MKFGEVPVGEAAGAILAHSHRLPGRALSKGRRLTAEDVALLGEAGLSHVIVARLEADDVHEDEAASLIATALAGDNLTVAAAFTGRVNLFAAAHGLAVVDRERLDRLNLADEAITVATLPPHAEAMPKQMVATIKIIPFAAPRPAVERCLAIAREAPLRIAPFRAVRAGLVQTSVEGTKPSVLDKTAESTRSRLEALGGMLTDERRCAHREADIAEAIDALKRQGCDLLLVAGASAIVDRRDVVPSAIERAGGRIEHFGMPVDPGNLLLLGRLEGAPVIGLPGCARSPKFNGFDQVLQRLVAGLEVDRRDIMGMGAGGLLAEIPSRPQPRAGRPAREERKPAEAPRAPKIAAVVLAAGQSRRMGTRNKLLAEIGGQPMVARVMGAVRDSQAGPAVVVLGHQAEEVRRALAAFGGKDAPGFVTNPDYAEGLSTSLRAGLRAVPEDADGALVCLGDMPAITPRVIDRLIAAFNPVEGRAICVPTFRGKRGNPVLWARRFFPEMITVSGDVGARHLIGEHADQVCEVEMEEDGVLIDLDTPAALAAYSGRRP